MRKTLIFAMLALTVFACKPAAEHIKNELRAPAYPLLTIDPLWKFYNETVERVPMSDWFYTDKPEYCMFIARSVVGGYFIKMLPEID